MNTDSKPIVTAAVQRPAAASEQVEAFLALLTSVVALKLLGLRRVSRILGNIPAESLVTGADPDVRRLAGAVAAASDLQPFSARCLQQCLALCWMLRRRGVAAELVMGVHKFPFKAHVWLECGEEVIQWEAGLGETANQNVLRSMRVIFRTGRSEG